MNLNDTLDPQIADTLLRRPSLDDLSRFVAGLATPIEAELIEAHMQRSPEVRMDVAALEQDLDTFSETLHQSLQSQKSEAAELRIGAHKDNHLALAASYNEDRPAVRFLDKDLSMPDGLGGHASASSEAPLLCSTLRISKEGSASLEPQSVQVSWPRGKRQSLKWEWEDSRQKWRTDVVLPEPWSEVSSWIATGKLIISM